VAVLVEESQVYAIDLRIGRVFLRELMRRRGKRLRIVLLAAVRPGHGAEILRELGAAAGPPLGLDLAPEPEMAIDRKQMARQAAGLEARVAGDRLEIQVHLPELVRLCRLAGRPDRAAKWQYWGLEIFNTLGFYQDAIEYGESARAFFRGADDPKWGGLRWAIFVKLFMSYIALQQPEQALRLAEEETAGKALDPQQRARLSYLLAMLHARFLPSRDLGRGEEYLERGLTDLRQAEMTEDERHFQSVFNRNGLAMIRHFQGRFQEAVELCREGFRELEAHLKEDKHRLHRSVLLYNMAQVYTAVGEPEEGLRHYALAMEMDPNYSEYFNDRGNVYLKLGRLAEACADYRKAIELSPPYFEVYTNLGQCYRRMGRLDEALRAYSISLDLQPDQALALAGRAQCHDAQGRLGEAIADYSASLALEPDQWEVLANRAVALYGSGDLAAALADLGRAVELAPGQADLYQNRAVALADLGRSEEAAGNLETYLRLRPHAEDRAEVEAQIAALAQPQEMA